MASDVGISANDDSHYLPPPLGGGGSFSCVLLLRLRASYPPRWSPYRQSEFRSRLRSLPVAQSAIRGSYYHPHSCIYSYSSRRFSHVLSFCQDSPRRHSFHSCTARILIFCGIIDDEEFSFSSNLFMRLRQVPRSLHALKSGKD